MTIGILALTAVNRYFCEVKPRFYSSFFTKKKTVFLILFVLLFTLTVSLTITLVTPVMFRWHYHYLFCQLKDVQELAQNRGTTISLVIGFVALPMYLILFCYGSVYLVITQHNFVVVSSLQRCKRPRNLERAWDPGILEFFLLQLLPFVFVGFRQLL